MGGFSLGLSLQASAPSALLGVELSMPYLNEELFWTGVWGDAVWDPRAGGALLGVGPEAGFLFFGVDGGYVAEVAEETRHGLRGRLIFSLGFASSYMGYTHFPEAGGPSHVVSLGILMKAPLGNSW